MNKNEMSTMQFLDAFLNGGTLETVVNNQSLEAKAQLLKANIEKKNAAKRSTSDKPSKDFVAGEPRRKAVLDFLNTQTVSVAVKEVAMATGLTSPQVTSALKQLVDLGKVDKHDRGRNKPLEYTIK